MTTRIFATPARTLFRLAGLEVPNLTGHKYCVQAYGCNIACVVSSIYPEPGRMVMASLRLKF